MSEYHIPFHIQEEIMKRLPVKSLVRFRCVSKAWKSLIESSGFIAAHSLHRHTHPQHLLLSYKSWKNNKMYVSYVDDDTFFQQRSFPPLPQSVKNLIIPRVVGCSHGLLCLYESYPGSRTKVVVLWNLSIRKSIVVSVPETRYISFGVCPVTSDPKIVGITESQDLKQYEVTIYSLSSGKWKSLSTNLPTKPLLIARLPVVTDRFIYWFDEIDHNMIMSFDLTNEGFEVIDLPESLARRDLGHLSISKLRDSLAMLQYTEDIYTVWMLEHGVQKSFTKLFTIKTRHKIVGFRKSGVPMAIMSVINDYDYYPPYKLVIFEPNSEQNNTLEILGSCPLFSVNSYMETLLLMGRSDCTSY